MRVRGNRPLFRAVALAAACVGLAVFGDPGAKAQPRATSRVSSLPVAATPDARASGRTSTVGVSPTVHAAVVRAIVRFALAWYADNATGVCSAVTPTWKRVFISQLNRINVANGNPLPLVTSCAEAVSRSRFIPRYLSRAMVRTLTRTVAGYPAVQVNPNTVTLENGHYKMKRIRGRWLLDEFAGI
jgi:hypothetical protein